jgi:protein TonB
MFEDSTFESSGRIRTRSRAWMIATLLFNGSILLALILIPLVYPEALPRQRLAYLLATPPPPPTPPPTPPENTRPMHGAPQMPAGTLVAPSTIPRPIFIPDAPEQPVGNIAINIGSDSGLPTGIRDAFGTSRTATVTHTETKGPLRLPSTIVSGLLIHKVTPTYPPIAVATRLEGTVILQATISKTGAIENLRVISGHPMLQQAAIDAVQRWAYRPYLLNGQPVEVESTIKVVFTLGR